jgi:hypothetical protein
VKTPWVVVMFGGVVFGGVWRERSGVTWGGE